MRRHVLPRAWGLAIVVSAPPWLGVAGGWALDLAFGSFPLLLVVGGMAGVCLGLACAYLATRSVLGRGMESGDRPVEPPSQRVPASRAAARHAFHVLVVEPDGDILARVSQRLHEAGLQVAGVPSGKLALRVLDHDGTPDVVLADLALPDMSARSLVTALRAHAHAHLPVGYLSREPLTLGRYGGEPILNRPFGTDRLMGLIDETFLGWRPSATP